MKRTLEISEETYQKIKSQLNENEKIDINSYDDMIGKKFFFRQVTYHAIGKVVKIFGDVIQLEDACWVADSGEFTKALKEGVLDEVEITGNHFIKFSSNVDFFPWNHDLPNKRQ